MQKKLLLLASAVVAALVVAGSASAANPRSVTVMTQNIYQGTELEHVLAATSFFDLVVGVATDYANVAQTPPNPATRGSPAARCRPTRS